MAQPNGGAAGDAGANDPWSEATREDDRRAAPRPDRAETRSDAPERTGGGNGGGGDSADLIDDALRLVDSLQRKLIVAGVRKGVSTVTAPPPRADDVWAEAIRREQPEPERPPLDRLLGVVRTSAPEVAGHIGRAGVALFGALGDTWRIVESEYDRRRALDEESRESGASGRDSEGPGAP